MINNFYTFDALTREWAPDLAGCSVTDAYSQNKNEFTLALSSKSTDWMLRCSVQAPFVFIFRNEGFHKAKSNVATLFQQSFDMNVVGIEMAERDRMMFIHLEDGWHYRITLFGTRANVFLVDQEGVISDAFRSREKHIGEEAPMPRPAPMPDSFQAFDDRWRENRNTVEQSVASAMTLFTRTLGREAAFRAGLEEANPEDCTEDDRRKLYEISTEILASLQDPDPHIYWTNRGFADAFSLIPLQSQSQEGESFQTVDTAVRVFVRRRLAEEHFRRLYDPLEKALSNAADHYRTSADRMLDELSNPSRAEEYEQYGHLLMASQHLIPSGAEEVELDDLFGEGDKVLISLDPSKSAVQNAQSYYRKAQRTRASRESAADRLNETEARAEKAAALLDELQAIEDLNSLRAFRKDRKADLAPFVQTGEKEVDTVPFRRYSLKHPYEVWVGRNAKQNDDLTFRHAQKYDVWFHARNMPGSHVVLRLPNRDDNPPKRIIHQAASIAAYYSKGRGSKLVPVMYTERKYVRSPRAGAPGAVHVEYEDVVMVEPHLPADR